METNEKLSVLVHVRLRGSDAAALETLAREEDRRISEMMRVLLRREARKRGLLEDVVDK